MNKKKALNLIVSKYEMIKKVVLSTEEKYFPENKGMYHEDITQDLFIKIQKELDETEEDESSISEFVDHYLVAQTYLYNSIKQLLIDNFRKESKYVPLNREALKREKRNLINHQDDPLINEKYSIQNKIDKYVETFVWFDKRLFNLYRYEFRSHGKEMSKQTKLSQSTIYRTVKRCQVKINEKLKRDYYEE